MEQYEHITKMENIMTWHEAAVQKINDLMDELEAHHEDYQALIAYYYSEQRKQDLQDEEADRIPKTMKRGVLSEDEIYDLMYEYHTAAIRMMEHAVRVIKD